MEYQLINGIYQYNKNPSTEATAWQGYDAFPGKDNYENRVIKAGTELVKLEPSKSGYFTTRAQYESLKRDGKVSAIELSEGLQVSPWLNIKTNEYEYRKEVSIVKLEHDIELAYGENTLANEEFGEGGFVQIYIPGYDGENRQNNETIGLKEIGREKLSDNVISKEQWTVIQEKHHQHLLKRNLFCYQKCKADTTSLMNTTPDGKVKDYCKEQIKLLDDKINLYSKKIYHSIHQNQMNDLHCPTYDENTKYLYMKSKNIQQDLLEAKGIHAEDMESQIDHIHNDLMAKIEKEIEKPIDMRNIHTEELMQAYQLHKFCQINVEIDNIKKCIKQMDHDMMHAKDMDSKLQTTKVLSSPSNRIELIKKLNILIHKQADLMNAGKLKNHKVISKKLNINFER